MFLKPIIITKVLSSGASPYIEQYTEEYKTVKKAYNEIIKNLANFIKQLKIEDPVEIFTIYHYLYRSGYLSYENQLCYKFN